MKVYVEGTAFYGGGYSFSPLPSHFRNNNSSMVGWKEKTRSLVARVASSQKYYQIFVPFLLLTPSHHYHQ